MFYTLNAGIYLIIIIYISFFNDSLLDRAQSFFDKIFLSEKSSPIYSIKLVNNDSSCPENTEPLNLFTFPKSEAGCLCNDNRTYIGKCSYLYKSYYNCKNINPLPEKNVEYIFGDKICVETKENENYTYIKNGYITKNIEDNSCEEGYNNCGIFDYNGHHLCVLNETDCPINEIIINKEEKVESEEKEKYVTLPFSEEGYFIHYGKGIENKHIVTKNSLKFSEGVPCIYEEEINIWHTPYPLDTKRNNYQCKSKIDEILYDSRYEKIFSMKKSSLILDNLINFTYSNDFPEGSLNYDIDLYSIGYLGIDLHCNFLDNYEKRKNNISSIKKLNSLILILLKISGSIYFIIALIKVLKHYYFDFFTFILDLLFILVLFSIFLLSIVCFIYLNNLNLIEEECGGNDQILTIEIKNNLNVFNKSKINHFLIIILILQIIVMYVLSIIFNTRRNNKIYNPTEI